MMQDQAEAKAVASAGALRYALCKLPVVDVEQVEYLAPDLLLPAPPPPPAPAPDLVGPRQKTVPMNLPMELREKWREHQAFFARKGSRGLYAGTQDAEWAGIPLAWRIMLMTLGGIGDVELIDYLAGRSWQELPPAEREAVQFAIREGKRVFSRLSALSMRTVG
ncbi:hypothetical protein ACFIQF_11535 [Comamonas sp. J-3]|uniref:hypothetical protein n=1 Tax=Comamonas trifloxystrobinivorans TaxID=3350256 RepID=UPI00372B083D